MRETIVSALLVLGASAPVYAATAVLDSTSAYASITWAQDTTLPGLTSPGCATQITVGPNNVPFLLGCSGPDGTNRWIYKLKATPCQGQCFGFSYAWTQVTQVQSSVKSDGVAIAADPDNNVWMVPSNGQLWVDSGAGFSNFTAANPAPFNLGRLSGIASSTINQDTIYGLGADAGPNHSLWQALPTPTSAWTQMDAQDGAAASKIVLFTGTLFGTAYQTPAVINTAGQFYFYNATTNKFPQAAGGSITDVTDHYCIATDLYQWSDLGNTWVDVNTPLTRNFTLITHIAYSNTGPSGLWGIDSSGHIFYDSSTAPPTTAAELD